MREDRDIDALLRRHVEQQLAGFDWDGQRHTLMHQLASDWARRTGRRIPRKIIAGAVLMLATGCVCMILVNVVDRDATGPIETTAAHEPVEGDPLVASTDPTTILLRGPARLLVCNDPMLAPHSLWDQ